MILSAVGL